jgi:hypothetical protein
MSWRGNEMRRSMRIMIVTLLAALLCSSAFAATASSGYKTEVDGMLSVGSDPVGGFGTAVGIGAGVGFDLSGSLKPSSGKLFGRVDINYFNWDETVFGTSLNYTRVPIFLGGRYYVPMSGSPVDIFLEAGLEISFDSVDTAVPIFFPAFKTTQNDLNVGISPGIGIEVPISNNGLFVGADARWHLITDSYFTFSFVLGKKF